jgi:hypothetical protein
MTFDETPGAVAPPHPAPLGAPARRRILLYLSLLIFLISPGAPYHGLIALPVSFFLKNRLHLPATDVALFKLMTGAPLYVAFAFGFVRDSWNPLGRRDRGYFMLFGALTSVIYIVFALLPVSYFTLLAGMTIATCAYLFVSSAWNGLTSTVGQQQAMSGQLAAAFNIVASIPGLAALALAGRLSNRLEGVQADQVAKTLFLIGAGIMAVVALVGAWRPKVVYDNVHAEAGPKVHFLADIARLLRHKPIYPALGIWFLWNFAPGGSTPLQYYLQDTLHARDSDWGDWNMVFGVFFIPTFALFGLLARKYSLRTLLWWSTVFAVPQYVPLLFVPTVKAALLAAGAMGLMGGAASAAYIALIIRSCPRGLQGTTLMASTAMYWIVSNFGDLLGTWLYDVFHHTFTVCVIAITIVYAAILPTLLLIPRRLIDTPDGVIPEGGFHADEEGPLLVPTQA